MAAELHPSAEGFPQDPGIQPVVAARAQQLQRFAREAARRGGDDEAIAALSEAVAIAPNDASVSCDLGRMLARRGELGPALSWFERAVLLQPSALDARFFLGVTLLRLGRSTDAVPHLRRAASAAPDDPSVRAALADAEFHAGNDGEASEALEMALRLRPGDEDLLLKYGEVLSRLGRHGDALEHFVEASTRWPSLAGVWMAFAQSSEEAGHADEAEAAYRRALALRPGWPQPLAGLLALRRGAASDEDVAEAEALLATGRLDDSDTALLGYPLGRVLDGRSEHGRAFAAWTRANAAREREVGPLDRAGFDADVERQLGVQLAERGTPEGDGESLVFVVGMPRSGTTLVEQVLAAHPEASGCGELPFFAELVSRWPDPSAMNPSVAARAASEYLSLIRRHGSPAARRFVDKAPLNALHLAHVARLFPAASVVWCRRDARDVALSIFSENFAKPARFATSLESIGVCINAQHRLMRHWQRSLGLRILELRYESVVDDFETEARKVVESCGLRWDPVCLDFHLRTRVVQTPSRWQVRQPVHGGSIGRWRSYEAALAPLLSTLAVPVEADGVPRS
jgi:Flp pilus assembly protein TadD